jgi:hypothetical protein
MIKSHLPIYDFLLVKKLGPRILLAHVKTSFFVAFELFWVTLTVDPTIALFRAN